MRKKSSPVIADYDSVSYDYETYWKGRDYEDRADQYALQCFLHNELYKKDDQKNNWYIDIGGSYGREYPTYSTFADNIIIFDYSLEALKKGKKNLQKNSKNLVFIAGNVYFLPFKDMSIQGGQMVRVMHHIKFADKVFQELNRVITNFFILEFANKENIKARIRAIMKGNTSYLSDLTPYQQIFRNTSQGSTGENQIFLNFHPLFIYALLAQTEFHIKEKRSVSNFRSPWLKKQLSTETLFLIEKYIQIPFSYIPGIIGPSVYLLLEKNISKNKIKKTSIEDILCCPICKGELDKKGDKFSCSLCKKEYPMVDGVYDFRYSESK